MNDSRTPTNRSGARMSSSRMCLNSLQKWSAMTRAHLRLDLARNHRREGRRSGSSSACRWRRASLSLPWFCSRPMAAGPSWLSPVGRRSSSQLHHCRRKIRRLPDSPLINRSVAAAEAAPPQAAPLAQTAPQDAALTATAALPDHTQLLQTMARGLANVERNIEQLRANQQQIASDNSKAIEELKASQEEIKRVLARVSEQNPPKTSPPPTKPTPTLRKPERTFQSPYARARPRFPREWIYEEW